MYKNKLIFFFFLLNLIFSNSYCNKCVYLYKNNKCILFLRRKNEIIKIDDKLRYENIDSGLYASVQEVRNNENLCGINGSFFKTFKI